MSWKNEQFLPSAAEVDAVMKESVLPTIWSACAELHVLPPKFATLEIWVHDEMQKRSVIPLGSDGPVDEVAAAQIRLRFRRTFKPARSLFFAQLMTEVRDPQTGFAGLVAEGSMKAEENRFIIDMPTRTVIYNSSRWLHPGGL
jgi:hypothetical protein